ncbi:MAG: ABC transporter permease [Lachnospiraceae bacterium]|nr:ABC transporter permease [Lachnospiraceae bacterium]
MNGFQQIFRKELDRVFKDRRMILSVFILPILIMVGVLTMVNNFAHAAQERVETHESIIYIANAPAGFVDFLKQMDDSMSLYPLDDEARVKAGILDGSIDLLIAFPESFTADILNYQRGYNIPQIKTFYNPTEDFSMAAFNAISTDALERYRQFLLAERVDDMSSLIVFTVNSDNPEMIIQDEARAGGQVLGMLIPYFVTILLFANAMGLGADMVAGEKERGTMASLLVSPAKRSSIVLAKVFSLMVLTGISAIIYVVAMAIFMPLILGGDLADMGITIALSLEQVIMLGALLLLTAILYAAIIVLTSVFAKTVREANTYIMPVYIIVMVVGMSTMFPLGTPNDLMYLIPVYGGVLSLQGIFTQELQVGQYLMALASTSAVSVVLMLIITRVFNSEKIMSK